MPLTFPTIAEQVVEQYRAATHATSLTTIALRHNGERSVESLRGKNPRTIFRFDDDTSLWIIGRGRSHQYGTELP